MNKTKLHEKVKKLHREGLTYREISKKTKVSIGTISNVLNGKSNPGYSRKDPETWSEPELKQKIAFSEAAIETKGQSMENVIESVTVATKGKNFKLPSPKQEPFQLSRAKPVNPISDKEMSRTINNLPRVMDRVDRFDAAVKQRLSQLPPQNRSVMPVSVPDSPALPLPDSPGVSVPEGHGSGYKALKLMAGIGAIFGGIVVYKEIEKKVGTVETLRMVHKLGSALCGITEDKENV